MTFEEPVKECEKDDAGADDLPQRHRAQENSYLPEEISQEAGCLGCEQAVFDHRRSPNRRQTVKIGHSRGGGNPYKKALDAGSSLA
jgi:hypothetical protein